MAFWLFTGAQGPHDVGRTITRKPRNTSSKTFGFSLVLIRERPQVSPNVCVVLCFYFLLFSLGILVFLTSGHEWKGRGDRYVSGTWVSCGGPMILVPLCTTMEQDNG